MRFSRPPVRNVWDRPPGGFTPQQLHEQRRRRRLQVQAALLSVALIVAGSLAGYRWVTTATQVDQSQAIDLYRAALSEPSAGPQARVRKGPARPRAKLVVEAKRVRKSGGSGPRVEKQAVDRAIRRNPQREQPTATRPAERRKVPHEGVYSWATNGYEQVGGVRRQFPKETQRIITHGDGDWTQHHYFSEERQIWTLFRYGQKGIDIVQQRNKVTFGPVTRESKIDFDPPMLAAPRALSLAHWWEGEWSGPTHGDYTGNVFERTTMTIGSQQVEVWGIAVVINLRGEQQGQVNAEVWFAPDYRLTVKEHYVQDVNSGGSRYHAEWRQTLTSLHPKQ